MNEDYLRGFEDRKRFDAEFRQINMVSGKDMLAFTVAVGALMLGGGMLLMSLWFYYHGLGDQIRSSATPTALMITAVGAIMATVSRQISQAERLMKRERWNRFEDRWGKAFRTGRLDDDA